MIIGMQGWGISFSDLVKNQHMCWLWCLSLKCGSRRLWPDKTPEIKMRDFLGVYKSWTHSEGLANMSVTLIIPTGGAAADCRRANFYQILALADPVRAFHPIRSDSPRKIPASSTLWFARTSALWAWNDTG